MPHSTLERPLPGSVTPARGYPSKPLPSNGRALDNLRDHAVAASSLVTTAGDYAAFLSHVCKGDGLPPDLGSEMLRAQSPAPADLLRLEDDSLPPPSASWGLGWMIVDLGGSALAGHMGKNGEFRSFAGFIRQTGEGLVILTNGSNGERMIASILNARP